MFKNALKKLLKSDCDVKIFESLDNEKISQIKTFEFEGDDWFLVIPKYRNLVSLKKGDEELTQAAYTGESFALRCCQDVIVNIFETKESEILDGSSSNNLITSNFDLFFTA